MEKVWNYKQIQLLLTSDANTVELFLKQFAPFIYTWSFYQTGADSKISTDLTAHILSQSVKDLPAFDPARETLLQWLKKQAEQSLEAILEHWQKKPQRPWAWSQLSDEILCELSRFRLDEFDERVLENPCVHEIAQATLTEIAAENRQLLIKKYCHLDSLEHIAEEMDCRVEDVQNQLYRSHHSFRREFFQLIAKANKGFSESRETGDIKILEANLEKLLSTTSVNQTLEGAQLDSIREQLMQTLETIEWSPADRTLYPRRLKIASISTVIMFMILGIFWVVQHKNANVPPPPVTQSDIRKQPLAKETTESATRKATQDEIDEEELKRVFALGKAGNVDALLEILKSGQFTSQRIAAPFIGNLADPSAIDLLQQAEEKWYPQSLGDNPFSEAIQQILKRFPDAAPPTIIEPEEVEQEAKTEPNEIEPTKQKTIPTPDITGVISDFSNQPIANAVIELKANPPFSKSDRIIGTVKTDLLGLYQFPDIEDQAISLTCQFPSGDVKTITQALWRPKSSVSVLNLGGRPALTGNVTINGIPLANESLYLSDTLDITQASFQEKVATDENGNFSFLGIAPGTYFIMNQNLSDRLDRLAKIEMPQKDLVNINVENDTIPVWLNNIAGPKDTSILKAILAYTSDTTDNLGEIQGDLSADNSIFFENVIPGSYVLKAQLSSGLWIQEKVEIESDSEEYIIQLAPIPEETATLSGYFLNEAIIDLFLITPDQRFSINLEPGTDGTYEVTDIPSDIYSLVARLNNQLVDFLQIDLQSELKMNLDINPAEMTRSLSPLFVVVIDGAGMVLPNAQVWLTGIESEAILTASSTGQGAFLAAPADQYTLSVAHPKYPTKSQDIILESSSILAKPNSENLVVIQLADLSAE